MTEWTGPGYGHVGQIGRAARQNASVGGLDLIVRANDRAGPPVLHVPAGNACFSEGGLRVEINKEDARLRVQALQNLREHVPPRGEGAASTASMKVRPCSATTPIGPPGLERRHAPDRARRGG